MNKFTDLREYKRQIGALRENVQRLEGLQACYQLSNALRASLAWQFAYVRQNLDSFSQQIDPNLSGDLNELRLGLREAGDILTGINSRVFSSSLYPSPGKNMSGDTG